MKKLLISILFIHCISIFISCENLYYRDRLHDNYPSDHFTAVGENGIILISKDSGKTWEDNSQGGETLRDILYAEILEPDDTRTNQYITVGGTTTGRILFSNDRGGTWTDRSEPGNSLNGIAYDYYYNVLITVGDNGRILCKNRSDVSWRDETEPGETENLNSITYTYGQTLAVGDNGKIMDCRSGGYTWTDASRGSDTYNNIAFGDRNSQDDHEAVAVGTNGKISYTVDYATSWYETTIPGDDLMGITFGNGVFIAVGNNGRIIIINNINFSKINWEEKQYEGDNLNSIIFGNGKFIAVGDNGRILVSPDMGQTWQDNSQNHGNLYGIAYWKR